MQRTQIILDKKLKKELQAYAEAQNKSLSEVIRFGMREYLEERHQQGIRGLRMLVQFAEAGGPKTLSEEIDETLYQL